MIGFAAAAAFGVFADSTLESSNIVGYNTTDFSGKSIACVGVPFTAVGDATTFKLGDFAAEGFDEFSDLLQTIDPDTADGVDFYIYLDPANYPSTPGWWLDDWSTDCNDVEFDVGTGFLGAFGSGAVTIKAAGQVSTDPVTVDFSGKSIVIVPNPLPRAVTLGEITADGFDEFSDTMQTLDPDTADGVDFYIYLDPANYPSTPGWWMDDWSTDANDVEIPAGEAMLGAFGSGAVELTFAAATTTP